ncbi:MAG TPA: TatD family hydrolase [Burkholderiaceae bacterium]|nr:TatD family hydrolase [Burkholderiaceae bacterium]
MWIDTHCHLDAPEFADDLPAVVARARAAGVRRMVIPAVGVEDWDAVRELAHAHDAVYALGIHPMYVERQPADALERLADALERHRGDARLVAVGEIGLDHFVTGLDRDLQERIYLEQLKLARRFDLPVLLHVRRSVDAVLKGLRRVGVSGGIAHAYNGSEQQASIFRGMGFVLGFGGAMTFERALQLRRLAATLPLEDLVLETDAPDIPPQWLYKTARQRAHGETHRNEPGELPRIARTLAELRGMTTQALAAATTLNACRVLPRLTLVETNA